MHKTGKIINCFICNKEFYRSGHWLRRKRIAHLCGVECVAKFNSKNNKGKASPLKRPVVIRNCEGCKNKFEIRDIYSLKNKRFCSVSCSNKNLLRNFPKGKDAYWWRGGKTKLDKVIRTCLKYKQWRSKIYLRDNFICILCGKKGKLQVDHYPESLRSLIIKFHINNLEDAMNCPELWDINLGRTLCIDCHKKTDTYGLAYIWKLRKSGVSF